MHATTSCARMLSCTLTWLAVNVTPTPGIAQSASSANHVETPWGQMLALHSAPSPARATLQVWVSYKRSAGDYRDDLDHLEALQARWHGAGVVVGVIMPREEALAIAKEAPKFLVMTPMHDDPNANDNLGEHSNRTAMICDGTELIYSEPMLDGLPDALRAITSNANQHHTTHKSLQNLRRLRLLVSDVIDGSELGNATSACLQALPMCGRAHAARALYHWWSRGDIEAGQDAVLRSLEVLKQDQLALFAFADLILRGGHQDPEIAAAVARTLAPFADAHRHDAKSQLVYLRALLQAGNDRRAAGRIAATLPKILKGRPRDQVIFAETLMEAAIPQAFRDQAERALTAAESAPSLKRWVFGARHKILTRCEEPKAAKKLMQAYWQDPVGQRDLNSDAWNLMVKPPTMGRFNSLALAQASKMVELDGDNITANNRDTLALANFLTGNHQEAITLQEIAVKESNNKMFPRRLQRYSETAKRKERPR